MNDSAKKVVRIHKSEKFPVGDSDPMSRAEATDAFWVVLLAEPTALVEIVPHDAWNSSGANGRTQCECDNTHKANDTVCQWCYSLGRRKWSDPEA